MGVINVTRTVNHTARMEITLNVSGVPDMKGMNSKREFQPVKLHVSYDYDPETGSWDPNMWTVSGPVRLKDGRTSQTLTANRYGWYQDQAPDWVRDSCEQFRPAGYVSVYGGTMTVQDH